MTMIRNVRQRAPVQVTVSGSFQRHLAAVQAAVSEFVDAGATVLSPADPRIVDSFGPFVFVSSDLRRSIKGVQNRHLESIRSSDLLWLVCPDGYVGASAAMELGFAVASGVPVYSDAPPSDWTLRQYVTPAGTPNAVLRALSAAAAHTSGVGLLVAPRETLAAAERDLELVRSHLLEDRARRHDEPLEGPIRRLRGALALPTTRR